MIHETNGNLLYFLMSMNMTDSLLSNTKRALLALVALSIIILTIVFILPHMKKQNDTTAVVQEIRTLNKWETASFTIEKIIDQGSSDNIFQQFLFGNKILLIAHGEAVAGFDLSTLSQNSVLIQGTSITVTLPKPTILYTRLDNSKTRVYDRQQGLLTQTDINFESQARLSAEQAIQSAACNENILAVASDNARKGLSTLLSTFHFSSITITIPQGNC